MIGNDVVDLGDPETAAEGLNPRFDARVFSAEERRRLAASDDDHALRWTLWAAKESAYKLAKRLDPATVFAHARFETRLDPTGCGTVRCGKWSCPVRVSRHGPAVHGIAVAGQVDADRIISGVGAVSEAGDASVCVRELATSTLEDHLDAGPTPITISSGADRIPRIVVGERVVGYLSLSHHGGFVAFVWVAPAISEHR